MPCRHPYYWPSSLASYSEKSNRNMLPTNMKIAVNSRGKIQEIQDEFAEIFPYLKLEFFSRSGSQLNGSSKKSFVNSSRTLEECRTVHNIGTVMIIPGMTVADLLRAFRDVYGLEIQV